MKKYYISREKTEMAIRANLSHEVQKCISSTDPLDIRERVNGIIEVDWGGDIQEFETWEEVERYFLGIIEELKNLEAFENEEN